MLNVMHCSFDIFLRLNANVLSVFLSEIAVLVELSTVHFGGSSHVGF